MLVSLVRVWNKAETLSLVSVVALNVTLITVASFEYSEADLALCLIVVRLSHMQTTLFNCHLFHVLLCYRVSRVCRCEFGVLSPFSVASCAPLSEIMWPLSAAEEQTAHCEALCMLFVCARCGGVPMEKPSSSGRAALEESKSLVEVSRMLIISKLDVCTILLILCMILVTLTCLERNIFH